MKAIDVFDGLIRFFKDHLLHRLRERSSDIRETDIRWVLTVPAIWSDAAKQFMLVAGERVCFYVFFLCLILSSIRVAITGVLQGVCVYNTMG